MSSDFGGSLYKSFTSSLYLSSNFQLSTVAQAFVLWLYTGFLAHLVLLRRVGTTLMLIALQLLRLIQVSTLWCDFISCERWLTAWGNWWEHVLIAKILNGFSLSWQHFNVLFSWGYQYLLNTYDSNGSPLQHYQPRNSFCHLFSIKSSSENL